MFFVVVSLKRQLLSDFSESTKLYIRVAIAVYSLTNDDNDDA